MSEGYYWLSQIGYFYIFIYNRREHLSCQLFKLVKGIFSNYNKFHNVGGVPLFVELQKLITYAITFETLNIATAESVKFTVLMR